MASKNAKTLRALRWLWLVPVPIIWCLLNHYGGLRFLETKLLDLRFRYRGEIEAPVNLRYVDVDTRAIQLMGERPWDRSDFGRVAKALIEIGGAKAVGFDFVFSAQAASKMVPRAEIDKRNLEFGRVTLAYPNIVLAAQYSDAVTPLTEHGWRQFPYLRAGFRDRAKNDVPELPERPISGVRLNPATRKMQAWGTIGLIDFDVEYSGDEVPRWVPLFAHTPNSTLYHLALQLALIDRGLDDTAIRLNASTLEAVTADGTPVISIPLTEEQLIEVNWFSTWENRDLNPRTGVGEVLSALADVGSDKEVEREMARKFFESFKGAIVLIGPTAALLQDMAPTPLDSTPVPKVGVHGNLLKTIVSGHYIQRLPESATIAITLVLTMLISSFAAAGGTKGALSKLTAALLLTAYVFLGFWLFRHNHLVLPMAAPLGAAFTTSFGMIIWQLIEEEKQKGRIKGMFGAYVSPQLVERMVESGDDPVLGGHDAEITAYFSDIQGFSGFSEKLGSGPLVELMNEYLTACTDIVQAQGGTLDKYIGDAVVAMFGAPIPLPDHAFRACVATQMVHQKLGELREKWKHEGEKWPEIVWKMQSRIGLNTGQCMIGNMGSRTRFNYTMMGDNVNLAARMESGAKAWGAYTMCTEVTKKACEEHGGDRVVFRALGRIVVMGRSQAVPIYEITGLKESLAPIARECIGLFEQGLAKYYVRDWDGAAALFKQSEPLEPNQPGKTPGVKTNPSLVYLGIVEDYKAEPPPENWDGAYVMKEK